MGQRKRRKITEEGRKINENKKNTCKQGTNLWENNCGE
jgi:hypothetical protein